MIRSSSNNNKYCLIVPKINPTLNRLPTKPTATTHNKTPTLHNNPTLHSNNSNPIPHTNSPNPMTTTIALTSTTITTVRSMPRKSPTSLGIASWVPARGASLAMSC